MTTQDIMKKLFLSFLLLASLISKEPEREKAPYTYEPIFAGTILAFFANNIPPGNCLLEPYFFIGDTTGLYNSHWNMQNKPEFFTSQALLLVEAGITPWLDISLIINESYTSSHERKSWLYGDTRLGLGFQISQNKYHSWVPDFRLLLLQSFPSGKYDKLDPKKNLADVSGTGAYETSLIGIWRKIVYFTPRQPVTINLNLGYEFPSSVNVNGLNLYGEGSGLVLPGQQFLVNLGLEYSLTVNCILGLDMHYIHQDKSRSKRQDLKVPSSEQFSLAPCIEYNPNTNFGIEAGVWFSIAGRNTFSFATSVVTIYWLL